MNQVSKRVIYDGSRSWGAPEEHAPGTDDAGSHLQVPCMRVRNAGTSCNTLLYTKVSAVRGNDVRKARLIYQDDF